MTNPNAMQSWKPWFKDRVANRPKHPEFDYDAWLRGLEYMRLQGLLNEPISINT